MAALTPYDGVQRALRRMDSDTHRSVGWTLVWQIAPAQLRRGSSVILDGMAGANEVAATRQLACEYSARCLVVLTNCDDAVVQPSQVEGRRRGIPGWHELSWDHVNRARQSWPPPSDVDFILDTTESLQGTLAEVSRLLRQ